MDLRSRILAERARRSGSRSLSAFVKQAWPYAPSVDPLVWGWHLDAICLHLEAVALGEVPRLLVNCPPGSAKSVLMAVLWPAWIWTWWPQCQFLFGSHAEKLALRDSMRCRAVIESDWYRATHSGPGGWTMRHDQNAKGYFVNTLGGERFATGIGGTGRRAHVIGVDDPLDAEDLGKPARDAAADWIGQTLSQRFVDPQRPRLAMIMQRLHEDDPSGRLLESGGVEHLCLPSEFDPDRRSVTHHTVDGERRELWRDPRTEEGELLFPLRWPRAVLESYKLPRPTGLGADGYAAQHQQRPTPPGGLMFHLEDWRFWKPDGAAPDHLVSRPKGCYQGPARPLPEMDRIILSVDGTFKKTVKGSYVAIHVWGAAGAGRYLLDRIHARMDYDECERALVGDRSLGRQHPIGGIIGRWPEARERVVEDKANGSALVNRLGEVLGVPGMIAEPTGTGDKEQRANINSLPYHRAGNCHLPDGAPWLGEYIAEHAAFPLGKTNDDVDAQSQGLKHLEAPLTTAELLMRVDWQ